MKHLRTMLVAALIAAPLAPRADEPQKVTFDVSGMLILNGFFNRGDLDSRETPKYARPNDPALDQREMGMMARQSRLRAAIGVPTDGLLAGSTLKGLVEADFGGGATTADTVIPRLRHYYVQANWKDLANLSLLVGQTWGVASDTYFPESQAHWLVPRFGGAGFLFRRAPQVRVSGDIPAGPLALTATVAALAPGDASAGANTAATAPALNQAAGNDSGVPNVEARLTAKYNQDGKPLAEVGLWSHYGRERYESTTAYALAKDVTAASSALGLDVRITLPYVQILGQAFQGQNLDVLNSIAGSAIAGTTAPANFRSGVVLDNTDPANPKARGMKTKGGFAQLIISPVKRLQLLVGAGTENPDDATLKLPTAPVVGDGYITRNTQYSAGTVVAISNRWKVSLEATRYLTTISKAASPNGRDVLPGTQLEVGSVLNF